MTEPTNPTLVIEDDDDSAPQEWDKPFDSTTAEVKDATTATATTATSPKTVTDWKISKHENDRKSKYGPDSHVKRDIVGYGKQPVQPHWPKGAKVALNFVINYEEGSESCTLHGDGASENLLSDLGPHCPKLEGERNLTIESMYDYGSRCGFWRLHRLFTSRKVPVTVYACGMALERNIEAVGAMKEAEGWEVASHGYRWLDYSNVDRETEKEHMLRTIEIHQNLLGKRPYGFYQGKPSVNTRQLVVEEGGFLYDSDAYNDDLPYWTMDYANGRPHLVIPYTLTENDMCFTASHGFSGLEAYTSHLKKTLDYLVMEGRSGQPKMMTVGLHCRLSRPARAAALAEFVDYAKSYGREVWICTREQIANHWYEKHLPRGVGNPIGSFDEMTSKGGSTGKTNRLSFLGNLTTPRASEEVKKDTSSPGNIQEQAQSPDGGDVI